MQEQSIFFKIIHDGTLTDLKKALTIYQIDATDDEGLSLLSWASICGDKKKVSYLLEQGANPNSQCHDGRTPLMYAASNNHPEIIQVLLQAGANPKIGDKSGWTAETWADLFWNEKSKGVLREHRKCISHHTPKPNIQNQSNNQKHR